MKKVKKKKMSKGQVYDHVIIDGANGEFILCTDKADAINSLKNLFEINYDSNSHVDADYFNDEIKMYEIKKVKYKLEVAAISIKLEK